MIVDLWNIKNATLLLGPVLLDITGTGSTQMRAINASNNLLIGIRKEAAIIRRLQQNTTACPPAPALCGALNASVLESLSHHFKRASNLCVNPCQLNEWRPPLVFAIR